MLPIIVFLHNRLALALMLFAVVLGLWGSLSFVTRKQVSPGFRSSYVLMIVLTAIQGLLGLVLIAVARPDNLLHVVYGAFAFLFLPGIYLWAGRGGRAREAAFLAAACWIVAIAYWRGFSTGT